MDNKEIIDLLINEMNTKHYSYHQLGLRIGIHEVTLSNIISGKTKPAPDTINKIYKYFDGKNKIVSEIVENRETQKKIQESHELKSAKRSAIGIAKQLCYKNAVISKLKNASSIYEVDRIMRNARKGVI